MARKPSDIVQPNLRIREDLRRRLEQAAKKRGVSLNYEMTARLKESFDREELFGLGRIKSDMEIVWARYSEAFFQRELQADLVRAAEALVALLAKSATSPEVEKTAARVQKATTAIELHAAAAARGMAGADQ